MHSTSSEQTERLGEGLGKRLKGGEVIELVSDVGGGKTTLVRGLARGFGSTDNVASPTFTISRVYKAPKRELHHFDFYRLSEPGIVAAELAEKLGDPQTVTVIEWGESVRDVLPRRRLRILLESEGENRRSITLACPPQLAYLVKGIKRQ